MSYIQLYFITAISTSFIGIQMVETLKCYSCKGGQDCGPRFSAKSDTVKQVESKANESLSSCSVRII